MAENQAHFFNVTQLFLHVTKDLPTAVAWCQENGLISRQKVCPECRKLMRLRYFRTGKIVWRCKKKAKPVHDVAFSALKGTLFERARFGLIKILTLAYFFSVGETNYDRLVQITSDASSVTSHSTIADWLSYFREICYASIYKNFQGEGQIDSKAKTVEVDEMTVNHSQEFVSPNTDVYAKTIEFDEMTVNHSQEVVSTNTDSYAQTIEFDEMTVNHSQEVVSTNTDAFAQTIEFDEMTVNQSQEFVRPNTDAYSQTIEVDEMTVSVSPDAYSQTIEVDEMTVNHSQEFESPDTDAQTIEKYWCQIKAKLANGVRHKHLVHHAAEYLYRREVKLRKLDPFLHFISCAASMYPPDSKITTSKNLNDLS